jgi:phosphodiesterase/alkaline phosphatase D-like protein
LIFHLISEKLFRSEDSMQKIVYALAILLMGGSLFLSTPAAGQLIPAAKKAPRVQITEGPELESARDNSAIIRWTSNNPGGSDEHFGVVHYGKNPKDLSQTAKSHIRLNQQHSYTVFRVRVDGLEPRTTYYYQVDSMDSSARSDGVVSPVSTFKTP